MAFFEIAITYLAHVQNDLFSLNPELLCSVSDLALSLVLAIRTMLENRNVHAANE